MTAFLEIGHYKMEELDYDSPRAEQPEKINIPLWPHQRAIMYIANRMENGEIFEISDTTKIRPKMGFINDSIGSGKTLTMLGIIAQKKTETIYTTSEKIADTSDYTKWEIIKSDCKLMSTLVIVNNHIVFDQWLKMIRNHTSLKCFPIDRKKDYDFIDNSKIIDHLNQFDIVLTKRTLLCNFLRYFSNLYDIYRWKRIIYDEAHEYSSNFKSTLMGDYIWYVSGTLMNFGETAGYFRLKSKQEFVNSSTQLPEIIMKEYICKRDNIKISLVKQFLTPEIMSHINAGDYAGALKILNGGEDPEFHETDVITALTKKLKRELKDTNLSIEYNKHKLMSEHLRKEILEKLEVEKKTLEQRIATIRERIEGIRNEQCSICFEEEPENKIIINPCLHVACSACIFQYIKFKTNKSEALTCQVCRTNIDLRKMRIFDPNAPSTSAAAAAVATAVIEEPIIYDKIEQAIVIIKKNPNGRYLIFAEHDATFNYLKNSVPRSEILKGDSNTIQKIVYGFKTAAIKSLIINSRNYAAGMNFQEATDVILLQDIGANEAQCIGRAQRPGRTAALRVHKLIYADE